MRRTKIVCTIGPASDTKTKLTHLIKNGMNVARLNFSHGEPAWFARTIKNIRQTAAQLNQPIAILQDLSGPKIRLGREPVNGLEVKHGQKITFVYQPPKGELPKNYFFCRFNLAKYVKKGQIVLIDDGKAQFEVSQVNTKENHVTMISHSNHYLKPNKGINLPQTPLDIPSLTNKDIQDIIFGINYEPEYIALSFVKKAEDIERLKKILRKNKVKSNIIAKIETNQAIKNIDEIINVADGIMIARGDLGLEIPIEQLPIMQKIIIQKCLQAHKPVIVATQMLASMTNNPIPTRAEATDVANAVFDNVDAVMLSEESAVGNFPVKAVNTLNKICKITDESLYIKENGLLTLPTSSQVTSVAHAACQLALDINAKYIIVPTLSGQSVRAISSHKPPMPIIAASNNPTIVNQLALSWGVIPILTKNRNLENTITSTINLLTKSRLLSTGDQIVILNSSNTNQLSTDQIQVKTI